MKKINKKIILGLVASVLCSTGVYAQTLKLAHALPTEHPVHQSLTWFVDHVNDETNLRVKMYPNASLGEESSLLQMVQNGTIAFTKVSVAPLESFSKTYKVLSLPYLYRDSDHLNKVLNGPIGDKILASSKEEGFVGLAFLDAGSRSFYADKPIKTPDDLKGMKIRVQNSPLMIDIIKALGATPVPLPYGELYSALQQGVVDGAENNIPSYYSSRHFEVKKVFSYDRHSIVPDVLIVSTSVWDKLTAEQQSELRRLAKETVAQQEVNWRNYVEKAEADLKTKDVTFVESDIAAFQEKVQPVYDKFKTENPDLVEILDEILNTK